MTDEKPEEKRTHYWCVVCQRALPIENNTVIHDRVRHPPLMTFDEELNPQ